MLTRHQPFVRSFLAIAGAVLAAANPLAMLAAKGIEFKGVQRHKSKGHGKKGRNLFRKGSGRVYGANGPQAVARRLRQIERGMLTASNGLVRA